MKFETIRAPITAEMMLELYVKDTVEEDVCSQVHPTLLRWTQEASIEELDSFAQGLEEYEDLDQMGNDLGQMWHMLSRADRVSDKLLAQLQKKRISTSGLEGRRAYEQRDTRALVQILQEDTEYQKSGISKQHALLPQYILGREDVTDNDLAYMMKNASIYNMTPLILAHPQVGPATVLLGLKDGSRRRAVLDSEYARTVLFSTPALLDVFWRKLMVQAKTSQGLSRFTAATGSFLGHHPINPTPEGVLAYINQVQTSAILSHEVRKEIIHSLMDRLMLNLSDEVLLSRPLVAKMLALTDLEGGDGARQKVLLVQHIAKMSQGPSQGRTL